MQEETTGQPTVSVRIPAVIAHNALAAAKDLLTETSVAYEAQIRELQRQLSGMARATSQSAEALREEKAKTAKLEVELARWKPPQSVLNPPVVAEEASEGRWMVPRPFLPAQAPATSSEEKPF
jgi:hypothetical protein